MADPGPTGPGTCFVRGLRPADTYAHPYRHAAAHTDAVAGRHAHLNSPAHHDTGSSRANSQTHANARPNTYPRCHSATHTDARRGANAAADTGPHVYPNLNSCPTHANTSTADSHFPTCSDADTSTPGAIQGAISQHVLCGV
ncbi:MAG: hypothetical protein HYY01_01855 [Chloroflexi bacterium]|nr:hypothetical protein [Chloroflexota bacterium]